VQEEAVRALCGGGEGRAGANSGGAGFSFFTHHANKTEQNASVVVAESSGMWLDKDAERLGWLPVGQGPFGTQTKAQKDMKKQQITAKIEGIGLTSQTRRMGFSCPFGLLVVKPMPFLFEV